MRIPLEESVAEIEVLSSHFHAILLPFTDPGSLDETLKSIKKRYPKADHYPFAYRVGDLIKNSDDGEPSGAAGRPFSSLLEEKEIDRALLVCVRYFGGSKLGLPRLRRTFLDAAKASLDIAKLGTIVIEESYRLSLSYHDFEILKAFAKKKGYSLCEIDYGEAVSLTMLGSDAIPEEIKHIGIIVDALPLGKRERIAEETL